MKFAIQARGVLAFLSIAILCSSLIADEPVRSEVIEPIRIESFNQNGEFPERRQGGNPREVSRCLVFDGSQGWQPAG